MARALILGCGGLGCQVGVRLRAHGWEVLGVRRAPRGDEPLPMHAGDGADPALYAALPEADAVLIAATPGLRRGRDHGVQRLAALASARWPSARLVCTGTAAVYADRAGGEADESAPLRAGDPAVDALLAIERAVLAHPGALLLRATALVGPSHTRAQERVRAAAGGTLAVAGDPDRPFSWIHDSDLAAVCAAALAGGLGQGVLNAAAPGRMTWRAYYALLAQRAGVAVTLAPDGSPAPRRAIDARRLHALMPGLAWAGP